MLVADDDVPHARAFDGGFVTIAIIRRALGRPFAIAHEEIAPLDGMMAVRSVVAVDVQLALILDVQFRGTSSIEHFHFEAAMESGVLGLESPVLDLEGLERLQVLGLLDLDGLEANLKASLQRGGGSARVRGLFDMMW